MKQRIPKHLLAMSAGVVAAVTATSSQAQDISREEAMAILAEARQARADATKALEEADAALEAAERLLGQAAESSADEAAGSVRPRSSMPDTTDPVMLSRANFCDGKSEDEIASTMLESGEIPESDYEFEGGLNWFTGRCLGIERWRDYKNVNVLDLQATASSSDGVVEAGLSFTSRTLGYTQAEGREDLFRTSYRTIRPSVKISTADATDAALFDLDKFRFESGIGIGIGLEWGRHKSKKRSELTGSIETALASARVSCIAANRVADPLTVDRRKPKSEFDSAGLALRSDEQVLSRCSGPHLLTWLRKDRTGSWTSIVKPIWGYDGELDIYGGLEASYAWSKTSFYPLRDTNTGALLENDLPPTFLDGKGATPLETNPFAVSGYLGRTWPLGLPFLSGRKGTFGLSGSLTYRRSFEVPTKLKDQTVCVDVADVNFDQCKTVNIGAPFEREGFVLASALKFKLPRLAFLPELGFTVKPSYAFDIDQAGIEIPVYFLADNDGKLNGGIKLTCTEDGTTIGGFEIDGECGAAIFFGSKFTIGGTP